MSIYFNQLNAMWDDMDMLLPHLDCVCHAKEKSMQREEQIRLVAFLVGLNEMYKSTKTQIMLLKPWCSLDQAYSMVVQVEEQKCLNEQQSEGKNMMSMNVQKSTMGHHNNMEELSHPIRNLLIGNRMVDHIRRS